MRQAQKWIVVGIWFLLIISLSIRVDAQASAFVRVGIAGRGTAITVAWNSDGTVLAVAGSRGVWLYDSTLRLMGLLEGPSMIALAWDPSGTRIVTANLEGQVQIWDVLDKSLIRTLNNGTNIAFCVAWSPDGTRVAAGSSNRAVRIWDARNGNQLATYRGHQKAITSIAWSPDNNFLASASADQTIRIWTISTGQVSNTLSTSSLPIVVSWSPNGAYLAGVEGSELHVWRTADYQSVLQFSSPQVPEVLSFTWSPHSDRLAISGQSSDVLIWNIASQQVDITLGGHTRLVTPVRWSSQNVLATVDANHVIRVWDTQSGQMKGQLQEHNEPVKSIAWSPNNIWIAGIEDLKENANLRIWDTLTGKLVAVAEKPTDSLNSGSINTLRWSADGQSLAAATYGKSVTIWDTTTFRIKAHLAGHNAEITAVAWNPSNTALAVGDIGEVRIWDVNSQVVKTTFDLAAVTSLPSLVTDLAWNSIGTQLAIATADGHILVYDDISDQVRDLGVVNRTESGQGYYSIGWSVDGAKLITNDAVLIVNNGNIEQHLSLADRLLAINPSRSFLTTTDGSAVFDIVDLSNVTSTDAVTLNQGSVRNLVWSLDGSKLAVANSDGSIVIYSDALVVTPTSTFTTSPWDTPTNAAIPTNTPTIVPTATFTPSDTPTATYTDTPTSVPTELPSTTFTVTPSDTPTNTVVPTETPTATYTDTPTSVPTATFTVTPSDTPTATSSPTPGPDNIWGQTAIGALSLNVPNFQKAIVASGSAIVRVTGGGSVVDNSTHTTDALDLSGSARIIVDQNNGSGGIYSVGATNASAPPGSVVTYTDTTETQIAKSGTTSIGRTVSDPFAPGGPLAIPIPPATNCVDISTIPGWNGHYAAPANYNLPPGCYTANNQTIAVSSTTLTLGTFTKDASGQCTGYGVYYFRNVKNVTFSGSSSLVSVCNYIYLEQTSGSFVVSASGTQDIEAPTSGPYKGIAYYQAEPGLPLPTNFKGVTPFTLSGGAQLRIYGTIYVPHDKCSLSGPSGLSDIHGQFICDNITLSGSSTLTVNWDPSKIWSPIP